MSVISRGQPSQTNCFGLFKACELSHNIKQVDIDLYVLQKLFSKDFDQMTVEKKAPRLKKKEKNNNSNNNSELS